MDHSESPRAPSVQYDRLEATVMHPDTPRMTLSGFRSMTAIMSYCANKPVHVGAGYKF